jgi:hypothetical protein
MSLNKKLCPGFQKLKPCVVLFFLVFLFPSLVSSQSSGAVQRAWSLIIGSDEGLYGINPLGEKEILWSGGGVKKILSLDFDGTAGWAILSDKGILFSRDLKNWEYRNQGLPVRIIKIFKDGVKSFQSVVQEIKDLEVDPQNPEVMVCAVKDSVFLSRNGGKTWTSLGMPSFRTNGIKAAAVYAGSGELTIFCSHSIYGFFYYQPDRADARWTELNEGLEKLESTGNPDEIADIGAIFPDRASGAENQQTGVFVSQTFRRRIYRLNWEEKRFELIWSGAPGTGTADSLSPGGDSLKFVQDGAVGELRFPPFPDRGPAAGSSAPLFRQRTDLLELIRTIPANLDLRPDCAVFWETSPAGSRLVSLSELWLLSEEELAPAGVSDREGLYLPVNHAMDSRSLKPYLDIIEDRKLDMVVIDMKDDYGRLRFTPKNQEITNWGRVFRPVDIDVFLREMKDRGIYTVARIVVFKDPEAARKQGGKYAVWDTKNSKPWVGYYDTRRKKSPNDRAEDGNSALESEILPADDPAYEIIRTYYDERWVDPYSEEVWAYNAAVAVELHERGFDEIQFDYIRFPTDGVNLANTRYRFQDPGMDMDSAIISFLRHVRSLLKAPLSVDIYGANGWYRTGARTGQEVELLSPLVDVICPMYYPSHFEQDFLAQDPPELRPYRIYFQGTQRTMRIGRGKIIVRPWIQAFYLNVAYDRKYYDLDYVRREVEGVRDAGRGGLTYWNNSGRYEDIPQR